MRKTTQKSFKYQSFEALYKNCALPLMKFVVKKMGGDTFAAEEICSRTILAALQSYHKFKNKSSFFTWVCKIALNKTADYYRELINQRSKFVAPTLEQIADLKSNEISLEEKLSLNELRQSIRECLNLLPDEKKKLLYLRYWKELSINKIAEILGVSERAAEGKVYRAKKEFKLLLISNHPEIKN